MSRDNSREDKIVTVLVKPGAGRKEVVEKDGELIVYTKERAERGRANRAVAKLLEKYFGAKVELISGFKSRRKVFRALR